MSQIALGEIIEFKWGLVADCEGDKIIAWRSDVPKPDAIEIEAARKEYIAFQASNLYKKKRSSEYDALPEQVGRLTKALKFLKESGTDIGPDGEEQVARVDEIKTKFPKPA